MASAVNLYTKINLPSILSLFSKTYLTLGYLGMQRLWLASWLGLASFRFEA